MATKQPLSNPCPGQTGSSPVSPRSRAIVAVPLVIGFLSVCNARADPGDAAFGRASTADTMLRGHPVATTIPAVTPAVFEEPGRSTWQHPRFIRLPGTFGPGARTPDELGSP